MPTCPASSILHKNRKRYQTTVAVTLTIQWLYNTNTKNKTCNKEQRTWTKACKINILYIIYLKKQQTIIRLPLIINAVFCVLGHTYYSCVIQWKKYSDSKTFTFSLFTFLLFIITINLIKIRCLFGSDYYILRHERVT